MSVLKVPTILSVIMNKGGVGKTTTCANLCGALSEMRPTGAKFSVAAIDLDPQANLSSILGLHQMEEQAGDSLISIAEFLDKDNREIPAREFFKEVPREYFEGRLSLLPGHIDLESVKDDLEFELKSKCKVGAGEKVVPFSAQYNVEAFEHMKASMFMEYRDRLKRDLAGVFDYIVIDTPPSRGFLTQFALGVSDFVLPVLLPGTKELDGLIMMEQLIADCWAAYNPALSVSGILINNLFEREVLSKDIRRIALERYSGREIMLRTEVPRSVRIAEAISNDITIFESEHRDSEAYKNIYRRLLSELYSRALTNQVHTTVSPKFFFDLHYGEEEAVEESVVKERVNE